jgi:hypothetical protein
MPLPSLVVAYIHIYISKFDGRMPAKAYIVCGELVWPINHLDLHQRICQCEFLKKYQYCELPIICSLCILSLGLTCKGNYEGRGRRGDMNKQKTYALRPRGFGLGRYLFYLHGFELW